VKELRCRDAGFDCDAVTRGDTVEEVMVQARPHVARDHHLEITADVEAELVAAIRDEAP
jgi:predicted small metal-binding protein